jgi:tryptophan-rich sensory protein
VFGPVWTVLYVMMAAAAWLVWRQAGTRAAAWPLGLYLVQLVLNTLWSAIFFGLRQPAWAAVEIVVLWLAIAVTLAAFYRRSTAAGMLLAPYWAWVTFAAALNLSIAALNA